MAKNTAPPKPDDKQPGVAPAPRPSTRPSLAQRQTVDTRAEARKLKRTLVMAGVEGDEDGKFVGYDGEQMRFAGMKFYIYGEILPSWCRILVDGKWVNAVEKKGRRANRPEFRRAAPGTLPGQAPKERIRQLVEDDAAARRNQDLEPLEIVDDVQPEVTDADGDEGGEGRASDQEVG